VELFSRAFGHATCQSTGIPRLDSPHRHHAMRANLSERANTHSRGFYFISHIFSLAFILLDSTPRDVFVWLHLVCLLTDIARSNLRLPHLRGDLVNQSARIMLV
jgi:hypothetical protein